SSGLDRLAHLHVQALDAVGRVDDPPDLLGESEEGNHALPGSVPDGEGGGASPAVRPRCAELVERRAGGVGVGGGVDATQLGGAALAFLPGEVAQRLTHEVDDA